MKATKEQRKEKAPPSLFFFKLAESFMLKGEDFSSLVNMIYY